MNLDFFVVVVYFADCPCTAQASNVCGSENTNSLYSSLVVVPRWTLELDSVFSSGIPEMFAQACAEKK